jgi:hypothetical protein
MPRPFIALCVLAALIAQLLWDRIPILSGQDWNPVPQPRQSHAQEYLHSTEDEESWRFTFLPNTLLWRPMLANPSEPRFYAKPSTLSTPVSQDTIDTAIGAAAGLYRFSPWDAPDQGFQVDVFAVVLSRWSNRKYEVGSDFRYGIPITWAWGNMHGKFGYEHTSSHLGDDTNANHGREKFRNIHDDLVLGLDYLFFNKLRVYGVYAWPFNYTVPVAGCPQRFDWGIEWSERVTTSVYGQPFAAFDMVLRGEQDYTPNSTVQVGWQWLNMDTGRSVRAAVEYFNGKSTLGQYFLEREQWVAVGLFLDF